MNLIVAVNNNWAIGKGNKLLYSISQDMSYFKKMTTGKVVVMGYNTLLSLPKSKPLKDRVNIVLCDNPDIKVENAIMVKDIKDLFVTLQDYNANDVFVIGGQSIYSQLVDYCSTAYVTKIQDNIDGDVYFPNLENKSNWFIKDESQEYMQNNLKFNFITYVNQNVKK